MSRKLEDLKEPARSRAEAALADLKASDDPCVVMSTLRTDKEQAAYHAQGRETLEEVNKKREDAGMGPITASENTYTVTDCDGVKVKSRHQSGLALDVVPLVGNHPVWPPVTDERWKKISAAFVAQGFRWGGDWNGDGRTRSDGDMSETRVDYPHYEFMK